MPLYSHEFQREVLYMLATNVVFATNYGYLLQDDSFDLAPTKTIFAIINQHMMLYEVELERKDLLVHVEDYVSSRGWGSESLKIFRDEVRDIYLSKPKNEAFVTDKVLQFIRKQALKKAIEDSITILEKNEEYEGVLKLIDKAISIGSSTQETKTIKDLMNLPDVYREKYDPRNLIKTGFRKYDQALQGGMAPGELHLFIGSPGCIIGNTRIPLLDGRVIEVSQLIYEKEFWVYSCTPGGFIVPGRGHSAREVKRVNRLIKITLDNGEEIITTLDHRHMMRDGTYKEAQYLKPKDSMMPLYRRSHKGKFCKEYELIKHNSTGKEEFTHRMVIRNIYGEYPEDKTHSHHIDKDKYNNHPDNLRHINRLDHYEIHKEDIRYGLMQKWADPKYREKMIRILSDRNIKNWKIRKYRDNQIAKSKTIMTRLVSLDPEGYSRKMSERAKLNIAKNPNFRAEKSQMMKDLWKDPDFLEMHREVSRKVMNKNWKNPEFIEQRKIADKIKSKYLKEKWKDPEYREAQSKRVYSKESRKKMGKAISEAHKDPEYHRNIVVNRCKILLDALTSSGLEINKVNFEQERLKDTTKYNGIPNWDAYIYYLNEFTGFTDEHYARIEKFREENESRRQRRQRAREEKINHKVVSVEFLDLDEPVPVYDITVDKYENFALEAGIFTHNSGKSTFGCNIGAYNIALGKRVFHATLEIKDIDVLKHYALRVTAMSHTSFLTVDNEEWNRKMKKFKKFENNLFVSYWPEKTVNAFTIRAWVAQHRSMLDITPDLIIIDYDDCWTGETEISLLNGKEVQIKDLVGKDEFWVYSCKEDGTIVPGRGYNAHKIRDVTELYEITLDNGKVVKCTANHRWMMRDGTYKKANELNKKDDLMVLCRRLNKHAEEIKNNKTGKYHATHKVVAEHFVNLPDIYQIHHIDGNIHNNDPANLKFLPKVDKERKDPGLKKKGSKEKDSCKIISVKKLKVDPTPVYDITVDEFHNFALSAGVFVHNCLTPAGGSTSDMYEDAGNIYGELIQLADYFKCPVVTFAQPKREAWDLPEGEVIMSHHLAHSARKAHKAYSVSSLNFKKGAKKGKLYIDKCRRGRDGVFIDLERDLTRAFFGERDKDTFYDDEE